MADKQNLINNAISIYLHSTAAVSSEDMENHIRSMEFFGEVLIKTQTAFLLIDYAEFSYKFVSSNFYDVAGQHKENLLKIGPEAGLQPTHVDDLKIQMDKIHPMMLEEFKNLDEYWKSRYKFTYNYRYKHSSGKEIQILQTSIFLKWDNDGKPLIKLNILSDISAYKSNEDIIYYVSKINESGETELVTHKIFSTGQTENLTTRELEILKLLGNHKNQKDIAELLSISIHTLKNHLKNMKQKLGCSSSLQLIELSKQLHGI